MREMQGTLRTLRRAHNLITDKSHSLMRSRSRHRPFLPPRQCVSTCAHSPASTRSPPPAPLHCSRPPVLGFVNLTDHRYTHGQLLAESLLSEVLRLLRSCEKEASMRVVVPQVMAHAAITHLLTSLLV